MTPQTKYHRHWNLKVKKDGLLYYLLRKPIHWACDLKKVDASPYPYGPLVLRGKPTGWYYMSTLSVLHRWTGLVLEVEGEYD